MKSPCMFVLCPVALSLRGKEGIWYRGNVMDRPLPILLLREPAEFLGRLRENRLGMAQLLSLAGFVAVACALYGVVLAGWSSLRLAAYVALKFPLLFFGTTLLLALFNWLSALLLDANLRFRDVLFIAAATMSVLAWVLLALTPVTLFLVWTVAPDPAAAASPDALRLPHNIILLLHGSLLAIAGIFAILRFHLILRATLPPACNRSVLAMFWVASYALVGAQLAWILRPFVGSPFYPVAFLRPDALHRNVYEYLFHDIFPFILGQLP